MLKAMLSLSVLFFTAQSFATTYSIEAKWFLNGKLESSSRVIALENQPASVQSVDEAGNGTYLDVVAQAHNGDKMKNGIEMSFEVGRLLNGSKTIISRPQVITKNGSPAEITVGNESGEELRIEVIASEQR